MFGSHLSIAGALANALREARDLGLDCVQVFTKNQQQWTAPPLDPAAVREWLQELRSLGWDDPAGPVRVVSHASYLANLASPKADLWSKSVELMADEMARCRTLHIPVLVHHPGSAAGTTREEGVDNIARAYKDLLARREGAGVVLCLENTVGSGSHLGATIEELALVRHRILQLSPGQEARVGFCLDTCHAHAAGYDFSTRQGAADALDEFDHRCGLANLRVVHVNDSKASVGSKRDLHQHIGDGALSRDGGKADGNKRKLSETGFWTVVNRPELARTPMILETPKGEERPGLPFDSVNVAKLRSLVRGGSGEVVLPKSPIKARTQPSKPKVAQGGKPEAATNKSTPKTPSPKNKVAKTKAAALAADRPTKASRPRTRKKTPKT